MCEEEPSVVLKHNGVSSERLHRNKIFRHDQHPCIVMFDDKTIYARF